MLNRDLDGSPVFGEDDLTIEYDAEGVACGVKNKDVVARCKWVIGDPSYFGPKSKSVGRVVRAIALLSSPLPKMTEDGAGSCQVIMTGGQVGRKNDLYLFFCGSGHKVAPTDKYVAFLSTNVEGEYAPGDSPEMIASKELAAGLVLLQQAAPLRIFYAKEACLLQA